MSNITITPQQESKAKTVAKNVGGSIATGFKEGAKLAAASEFNNFIVDIFEKMLIEKLEIPEETVKSPLVHAILAVSTPVLLITFCEMFGDKIPHADKIKAAAEVSLTAVSAEELGKFIAPLLGQIMQIISKADKVIDPINLGLPSPTESVVDAELRNQKETTSTASK